MMDDGIPQYLPAIVLDIIFSNLEPHDLLSCMLVCQNWYQILNNDKAVPWRLMCQRKISQKILKSELLSNLNSPKAKLRALYHAWNPLDCSDHIMIEQNGFTLHRNLFPQRPNMVRTKIGYMNGKHVWEITWIKPPRTVAMVGVSTQGEPIHQCDYVPLLGIDKYSWGWNLSNNVLLHNGIKQGSYPSIKNTSNSISGEKIKLVLDCENGVLHFEKSNEFLGIAFKNLPKLKLYPTVGTIFGSSKVSVVYIGKS
ncbi:Concanavalin A-like lectin/glucanase domain,SPRY domain,F-box domain,B30.2/SPRY domain [Cinara cedri]|uniref:Concanavalin A-like lectin/glucanase domain,SPRY domain,F-box domain,B30.2/SPRY domain n=1 Tax=Cinara cedri TaxID=506608 RepID=A0A5E4M2U9_9HEMI|nr:Concanavalin A-like lectin/glucanase domain,SPRY domain,F-box domain,B30.2/SPRY domain [Cinara cedri]